MSTTSNATLAAQLAALAIHSTPVSLLIQTTQLQHRLNLLEAWFTSLPLAQTALKSKRILEIGCGQGDTTIALAWAVGPYGKVIGLDPAPLDYGSPYTLEQAQSHLSASTLGDRIEWVQADLNGVKATLKEVDYVVLSHSLLYMFSESYVAEVFQILAQVAGSAKTRVLVAEWGMRASDSKALPHLYAVKAQGTQPPDGRNVNIVVNPERIVEFAKQAGWVVESEAWIESPEMDDGKWEVYAARAMGEKYRANESVQALLEKMESSIDGPIRCMDVYTCKLQNAIHLNQ